MEVAHSGRNQNQDPVSFRSLAKVSIHVYIHSKLWVPDVYWVKNFIGSCINGLKSRYTLKIDVFCLPIILVIVIFVH